MKKTLEKSSFRETLSYVLKVSGVSYILSAKNVPLKYLFPTTLGSYELTGKKKHLRIYGLLLTTYRVGESSIVLGPSVDTIYRKVS